MTLAAMNVLDILACDIKGACLTDECRKIIHNIAGAELGSEEGVIMLVKMYLWGLKSPGSAFRDKSARVLHGLN